MKWPRKKSAALFIFDGPYSLLHPGDKLGSRGWVNKLASLRVLYTPLTLAYSWTIYQIEGGFSERSDLPKHVLRDCSWNAHVDKENDDDDLRITVRLYDLPDHAVPDWYTVADRAWKSAFNLNQSGPLRFTQSSRRYHIPLGSGSVRISHHAFGDPVELDEDWTRVRSFAIETALIEPLAECYDLPLLHKRLWCPANGRYGDFMSYSLHYEEAQNENDVEEC